MTGYASDFSWVDLAILDDAGIPIHNRGVSPVPGLSFIGLPWLRDQGSATLFGVAPRRRGPCATDPRSSRVSASVPDTGIVRS